jgi:hypothetical protein
MCSVCNGRIYYDVFVIRRAFLKDGVYDKDVIKKFDKYTFYPKSKDVKPKEFENVLLIEGQDNYYNTKSKNMKNVNGVYSNVLSDNTMFEHVAECEPCMARAMEQFKMNKEFNKR